MGRIAIFIDGGYLDRVLKDELSAAKIDYGLLAGKMTGSNELLRTYYYNCLPYQSNPPTAQERKRFGDKQSFYAKLNKLTRFEVRLGRLAYRGMDGNGRPLFEQKRVDLMLGLNLVLLSVKRQITHAAILAGDSDFIPAIEAAKNEGVLIHLFHGLKPHSELWDAADERATFDRSFISPILRQ